MGNHKITASIGNLDKAHQAKKREEGWEVGGTNKHNRNSLRSIG